MSEPTDTGSQPDRLFVGVGIGAYVDSKLEPLGRAVSDVESVEERFRAEAFSAETCLDQPREGLAAAIEQAIPADGLAGPGSVLVVLWAGHAERGEEMESLRLLATDNEPGGADLRVVTASDLAQVAARSGASQILILLDACRSGRGVVDAAAVVDRVRTKLADQKGRWAGVVASCQDYEKAVDGAFVRSLLRLLEDGPIDPSLRSRWSIYQAGLRGDDLIDALIKEWDEDRQLPKQASSGDAWFIMGNPLYRPGAPEQVVEHLLWAARGGSQNETGIWFTGRASPLEEIVRWLASRRPGLCVITGPAGCGKSAVAGRIVSLSNLSERAEIIDAQGAPAAALDPGEGSVDAHVQARGMTLESCSRLLGNALGVVGATPEANHHEVLAWAAKASKPPVVVVDGLDEAGPEGFRIATDLLAPLAGYALVILASREVPGPETGPSLLASLGPSGLHVDLGADPDAADSDVRDYVIARLTDPGGKPVSEKMDPDSVAREIVELTIHAGGERREGGFLLARVLTSQLIEKPVDTSQRDWQSGLAGTIEEAFQQDLHRDRALLRDGEELPQAGRELLTALILVCGHVGCCDPGAVGERRDRVGFVFELA